MYFDDRNNYFQLDNNKYNYNINIDNIFFNRKDNTLVNIEEGLNRGNMFNDLYDQYKDHKYNIKINSKKDELLYNIQMYSFAINDLNLYLDLHPNDVDILNKFTEYNRKLEELKKEYSNKYNPICLSDVSDFVFNWINNPWPWDKGGNK